MNQRELAEALGIDPGLVSRLKAKGMPTNSVEAAQAWRRRHVAPYAKVHRSAPAPAPAPAEAKPQSTAAMDDELLAFLAKSAVLPAGVITTVVAAVGAVADERLRNGEPLGALEPALRAAMAAVPKPQRRSVALSVRVFRELCGDVIAAAEAGFASEAEREADRQAVQSCSAAQLDELGAFWYSVAAGEFVQSNKAAA